MKGSCGLAVAIGSHAREPGVLGMGWQTDADIPFRPGDEFPFVDRAVSRIDCGQFLVELEPATKLYFLLECRRSLEPGGEIRIFLSSADSAAARALARIAATAGLEEAESDSAPPGIGESLRFTKTDRRLRADPLVSILIPAYNERFFDACLDSALAQTYEHIEIVICDDSAGSGIERSVNARSSRFPIRYERNATRRGPRGNFTRCFERSRGEFVKFLCDDDRLAPNCVAALLDAFRKAPDITLATSARQRIDEYSRKLDDQPATVPIVDDDSVIAGHALANAMIIAGLNTIGEPSTVLFRKSELFDQAPEYFHFGGIAGHGIIDMVTWATLLLKGDAVYLCERLSSFRFHPGQRQHDPAKSQRNIESIRSLQTAWLNLGLQRRLRPDVVLSKPLAAPDETEWRSQPVLGFAARPVFGR